MQKLHIKKQSYNGYCIGTGVEYPGIIVHGKTNKELQEKFGKALDGHIKALYKYSTVEENIEVLEVEGKKMV